MRIFTPYTKCDFIGCDVPNISVEKFASSVCHAIRTQFAEREHVSRLFEWIIDTQKTVTISRPFVYAAPEYGKLFRHPTAVRRGVSGFRVAKHIHLPVTIDKQAETAGRERDDAHVGEWTERFWDGLFRRRVVLYSTAGELDVAVDRDDASDPTQSEVVVRVWRLPLLGYGKLCDPDNEPLPCPLQTLQHRQIRAQIVAGRGLDVAVSELACDH